MRWRRRYVAIASQCVEASFSITEEDEVDYIERVGVFKYLRQPLDWSDDDWPEVRRNIRKARQV